MTSTEVKSYLVSIAMASAILFGVGNHPTVDAIILTLTWIILVAGMLTMIVLTIGVIALRKDPDTCYDEKLGKMYKALSEMHNRGIVKIVINIALVVYWLYALIVQVWTVTAVFYVIYIIYVRVFAYATKDLAKDYFLGRLKGEGMAQ